MSEQRIRIYNYDMALRLLRKAKYVYVGTKVVSDEVYYVRALKGDVEALVRRYRDEANQVTLLFDSCEATREVWIG